MDRLKSLDTIRGALFFPMLIYHLFTFYDLRYGTSYAKMPFIDMLGYVRILYIIVSGFSLYQCKKRDNCFTKKLLNYKLIFGAIFITLISHILYPNRGIKFGILHFLYVASLIGSLLDHNMLIILTIVLFFYKGSGINTILGPMSPYDTMDWFPLLTCLPYFLKGMKLAMLHEHIPFLPDFHNKTLDYIGKNSLYFYVIHFVVLMLISKS